MTVMARFRAPNWTLNSNDSSPHSSLPLISTPGGSRAGIWVFVGAGSRPVLLQTSRRRPLQLLPGFEIELQTSNSEPPRTSNLEFRAVDIEFSRPELQIKRQTSCRRPLRLLPASSRQLRIQPPRTSNQASFD